MYPIEMAVLSHVSEPLRKTFEKFEPGTFSLDRVVMLDLSEKISKLTEQLAQKSNATNNCADSCSNSKDGIETANSSR